MKRIAIVGAGFSGTMTAVQLIRTTKIPLAIFLFDEKQRFHRGIAYSPFSAHYILNVPCSKMSAFPDEPNDFVDWYMESFNISLEQKEKISNAFLPREIYGKYLTDVWKQAQAIASTKNVSVSLIPKKIKKLKRQSESISLFVEDDLIVEVDYCVLATGNQLPGNPKLNVMNYVDSPRYFRNPWDLSSLPFPLDNKLPVCIIGNGLTMAETVLGLREKGFEGLIYSISPNGFQILPNRLQEEIVPELNEQLSVVVRLADVLRIVNKWKRKYLQAGLSFEPLIATLRPHVQRLWIGFSLEERKFFMSHLRHAWGVARHRISLEIHQQLELLRDAQLLKVIAGRLIEITDDEQLIHVSFKERKSGSSTSLKASVVINCTGPETDISRLPDHFLYSCLQEGLIVQDDLRLGIRCAIETFTVISSEGKADKRIFAIGPNLKGELWESTAVNEIRRQAKQLAVVLLS
jgi:uncharacterized NAD(P)/FAD-binding protein YdhS